jgi:hypothetical protein
MVMKSKQFKDDVLNARNKMKRLSLVLVLLFAGCDSSDSNDSSSVEIEGDKTLIFYNSNTQNQYVYFTETGEVQNLNSDSESNFYMPNKDRGTMFYWADEYTDGEIDEKVVMLKESFEGNISYQNLIYIGHFHDTELASHSPDEFAPENISEAKQKALIRLNSYLAEQREIEEEISEALNEENETLCNFFVPFHEEHEEMETEEEHEEIPHFALSETGKLYIFTEEESELKKIQAPVVLNGVTECSKSGSGITSSPEGVFVFSEETQKLYLVDAHGMDYHQHSQWSLGEFLPSSFEATQMIGFGLGEDANHTH